MKLFSEHSKDYYGWIGSMFGFWGATACGTLIIAVQIFISGLTGGRDLQTWQILIATIPFFPGYAFSIYKLFEDWKNHDEEISLLILFWYPIGYAGISAIGGMVVGVIALIPCWLVYFMYGIIKTALEG